MRIAITGANSFIGKHLLTHLASLENVTINALAREHPSKGNKENIINYCGDLLERSTLNNFIENCDVIINLAYLWKTSAEENIRAIDNLAAICAQYNVKRFIHCSTISVYGDVKSDIIDENTSCNPKTNYAKIKWAIENHLLSNYAQTFEIAILRPSRVFGPGGKNLLKLAHDLKNGSRFNNYIKSCLSSKRAMNLVSVNNVVAALVHLVNKNAFENKIYLITDDEIKGNNYCKVESYLIKSLKAKSYLISPWPLPLFIYEFFYKFLGRGTINAKTIYVGKNLSEEGFVKPFKFHDELEDFVKWYNQSDVSL
jgi:nucleoside-diphosphate-sugar epimerase